MPSRARSWRRREIAIGTLALNDGYVLVKVVPTLGGDFGEMLIERQLVPGVPAWKRSTGRVSALATAIQAAERTVLQMGGTLDESPEGLHGCRVPDALSKAMFSEYGMARFVHVGTPAPEEG